MKEATGELSMTVVVIVAVIALVAIIGWLFGSDGPAKGWIEDQWNRISNKEPDLGY